MFIVTDLTPVTTAVKRLMREAIELKDPTPMYFAQPLEENLFEWHFTILGPGGTDFEGGLYHGRIILPTEYPMKPPSIIMLTVRFMDTRLLHNIVVMVYSCRYQRD